MLRVLIPTDFSEASKQANKYAVALASKVEGEIYFFHAYHFPVTDPLSPAYGSSGNLTHSTDLMEEHEKNMKNQLINICSETRSSTQEDIQCDFILKPGFFVDQILETVREKKIDLIIMGTKGASGIKEAIFGSNTADVLEKAPCPVLAVPEDATYSSLERILFTTDHDPKDIDRIKIINELFSPLGPQVIVIHIVDKKGSYEEKNAESFERRLEQEIPGVTYSKAVNNDVIEGINKAIKDSSANMVAITNRKKGFLDGLFSKNISKKMVNHTKIPLFAFND